VTASSATSVSFASSTTGAVSAAGSVYLYCGNTGGNDAVAATPYTFSNTYTRAGNYYSAGKVLNILLSEEWWSSSAAPGFTAYLKDGSQNIYRTGAVGANVANSLAAAGGSMGFHITGLGTSLIDVVPVGWVVPSSGAGSAFYNYEPQPFTITGGSSQTVTAQIYFASTGCCTGTYTYVSGGTPSGTGNVSLSGFNDSCSGTTATMAVTSGTPGAVTFTAPGQSCTTVPTTATCTAGTASCSGTMTFSGGTLRGAAGNAVLLNHFVSSPY
jgi:hypothetical protein